MCKSTAVKTNAMSVNTSSVNLRRARLVMRWATMSGFNFRCRTLILICNQPASHPRPTQPSIPAGSVNEYQHRPGRQRQVWFIPSAGNAGKTVRSLENAFHI